MKNRFSCIVEAHESTRQRIESVTKRIHDRTHRRERTPDMEGHARKCVERCCELANKKTEQLFKVLHYNLVHKFIPMSQLMKIPDAKAAVDKEWTQNQQGGVLCILGSRTFCTDQFDVQEATASISQLHRIRHHIVGCWFAYGWFSVGVGESQEQKGGHKRGTEKQQ